jgi:hypothetical protein
VEFSPIFVDPDLSDIIDSFVTNTVAEYEALKICMNPVDHVKIQKICHRVLGTAISYGFNDLDKIVKKIQDASLAQDNEELHRHFNTLSEHIDFIKNQFSYSA